MHLFHRVEADSPSQAASGDFPTVLYEVISKRSSVIEGSLSIDELNEVLDQLAENMGKSYVLIWFKECVHYIVDPCVQ